MKMFLFIGVLLQGFLVDLAAANPISGRFLMKCEPNDAAHATVQFDFNANHLSHERTTFADFGCSSAMIFMKWEWGLVYPESGKINMVYKSQLMTPLFQPMVEHLNRTAYCGYQDWKVGVGKEILGRICNDYAMPKAGMVKFQIYENKGDSLLLGDDYSSTDGSTEELRPTRLRTEQVYRRVIVE